MYVHGKLENSRDKSNINDDNKDESENVNAYGEEKGGKGEREKDKEKEIYDQQPYIFLYSGLRRNVIHKRFANQMLFSERPGILANMLRLMSIKNGITNTDEATP